MNDYRNDFRRVESETYWSLPRVWLLVLVVVCISAIGFVGKLLYLGQRSVVAPIEESIRRDTMIQSRVYVEAMVRELRTRHREYTLASSDEQKRAILAVVRHDVAAFDPSLVPVDLRPFVDAAFNSK